MIRRTFLALATLAVAALDRLRAQNRGELERMRVQQLADTPHSAGAIMRMATPELVAILKDGESPEFAKAKACQRLAVVGDESAVPAVAALLVDDRLSHYARTALEPMPGPAADRALREALPELRGSALVGVINSIGWRRDTNALGQLAALRHGDDPEVARAATAAISRIRRP